jgi:multidrug resistance efflux pump
MTTDHDAAIAAAEARLAEAQADVDRLRAQLAAEQPRKLGWADGIAAAHRRHPHLQTAADKAAAATREAARPQPPGELDGPVARTPAAEYAERHGVDITSVEGAKAEARRRGAARNSSHR